MYLCVREINIVSFYDFSIGHCNCLDSVVYFILFILYISVPDEGYSRNVSCALILISTFFISMLSRNILQHKQYRL
jgi:hypothetical protein